MPPKTVTERFYSTFLPTTVSLVSAGDPNVVNDILYKTELHNAAQTKLFHDKSESYRG